MARLPYLEKSDLAPEHRDLFQREIALYKLLAHSPGALRAFQGLGRFIRHGSTLDPRLRELAILQVGYLARFSGEHLVDLIVTIAFYNAVVRVLASIAIDVEPEYWQYLERYPLRGQD